MADPVEGFNVVGSYDQPSYVEGDPITVSLSGDDVHTVVSYGQIGPLHIPVRSADGHESVVDMPAEQVTITSVEHDSVVIDTSRPIVDDSPTPRAWAVSTDKLSISSVA